MLRTIAAIVGLAVLGGYVAVRLWARYSLRRVARRVFVTTCRMYGKPHEWRSVDARAFPDVDHGFYAEQQAWLEERGFRWLGDVEDVTARGLTGLPPTFLRLMVGPDGATLAGTYHFRVPQPRRATIQNPKSKIENRAARRDDRSAATETEEARRCAAGSDAGADGAGWDDGMRHTRMLEFVTYLDNGMSVSTAPLNDTIQLEDTPGHVRRFVPPGLPPENLLERHHTQVQTVLHSRPGVRPAPVADLPTLLELLRRSGEQTASHRREIGFLTDDEVDRHAGNTMPRAMRDALKIEIARLRRRYLETGALP